MKIYNIKDIAQKIVDNHSNGFGVNCSAILEYPKYLHKWIWEEIVNIGVEQEAVKSEENNDNSIS